MPTPNDIINKLDPNIIQCYVCETCYNRSSLKTLILEVGQGNSPIIFMCMICWSSYHHFSVPSRYKSKARILNGIRYSSYKQIMKISLLQWIKEKKQELQKKKQKNKLPYPSLSKRLNERGIIEEAGKS